MLLLIFVTSSCHNKWMVKWLVWLVTICRVSTQQLCTLYYLIALLPLWYRLFFMNGLCAPTTVKTRIGLKVCWINEIYSWRGKDSILVISEWYSPILQLMPNSCFHFPTREQDCCGNHLSQRQMITQAINLLRQISSGNFTRELNKESLLN